MFVIAAVVDDVSFFSFVFVCRCYCCCCLFVCMFLLIFPPFAKLVLYRFLTWFSISLICLSYIHVIFFCTLVLGSRNVFFLYPSKARCHFFVYLKVGGGQLESLRYFDHHTHFITCTVIILSCNHVL